VKKKRDANACGVPKLGPRAFTVGQGEAGCAWHKNENKQGENMKKLFALVVLSVCMAAPSFGADAIGHSAKIAGKDSYKAAKTSVKDTGKAGIAVVKFLF
jgi:hypothetical protein